MEPNNNLFIDFNCPHCHKTVDMKIEICFGENNQYEYVIGDHYNWLPDKPFKYGGRPEGGNMDGEVYETCPQCGSAFTAIVEIRNDIITRIVHDFAMEETSGLTPPLLDNKTSAPMPASRQGIIKSGEQWQLTPKREAALLRLAELGVDIYSLGGDEYTLMIPHELPADHYIDIGYLIAQLADEGFPTGYEGLTIKNTSSMVYQKRINGHPPVYFVDGYPRGLKYRVQPSKD
jgi:hypothetical protein